VKILYFDQHFGTPKGATGSRSYAFSKALIRAGHTVTMVCGDYQRAALDLPRDHEMRWSRGVVDGIDVISLPLPYSNQIGLISRSMIFLRYACRATRIALESDCDLVFATSTPITIGLPALAAQFFRNRPFVFEVRDLWPELPRALGLKNPLALAAMDFLETISYRHAIACIGLSPGIVEGIRRKAEPDQPIAMIPNCCDLELFVPRSRSELDLPGVGPDDFVAGFMGAHGTANGLDILLEAAAILKSHGADHIRIVMIGDGKQKPFLMEAAQRRQLDNCIFLPPIPREKLAVIVGSFDCGLQILKNIPAFYYGTSPNKFFDYISAGLPVINNYPGWLADLIQEHGCGLVAEPDDPEDLAAKLMELAATPERRAAMGHHARQLAETEFSRFELGRQFVRFLEDSFARHRNISLEGAVGDSSDFS